MIGVIAKPGQAEVVEEFFELFKTPWEVYRPGRAYEAVIATSDQIAEVKTKLLIIYGRDRKSVDSRLGIVACGEHSRGTLTGGNKFLPIYCGLLTFTNESHGVSFVTAGSGIAGLRIGTPDSTVLRLGYDLFDEIQSLLTAGQPVEHAHVPTLEIHIQMLREWILNAGIPLLEIPPSPAGHSFSICLTHDIDFVGIRRHKLDHTMWGFLYRATVGALRNAVRGRLTWSRLVRSWQAAASLPLVYAGWAKDFWEPFEWYLKVEAGLPATYFLIPFKRRAGEKVPGRHASRRATAYDIGELSESANILQQHGCELGVHGIDSWHDPDRGKKELAAVTAVAGRSSTGIRMHWLLQDENTPRVLEQAGYAYDSTCGYNETVGYRAGTGQVFSPFRVRTLLELPLHIQDGALFYPRKLDLSEEAAEERCKALIDNASKFGGVLTLLWHDRSHAAERFWGDFYIKLLRVLKARDVWFGTASEIVAWFRKRRAVRFELSEQPPASSHTRIRYEGEEIHPPLTIRFHVPSSRREDGKRGGESADNFVDISWNGKSPCELDAAGRPLATLPDLAFSLPK